jgi:hypothetical protein
VQIPLPLILIFAALLIMLAVFRTLSNKPRVKHRKFKPRWRDDDRPTFR